MWFSFVVELIDTYSGNLLSSEVADEATDEECPP
jgi:hypothetical protein